MSTQGTFVHDFELKGGNPHCFLANQQQLHDVKNFCGSATKCCILGFDPTFTLGQFYVTFTTFRHPVFVNKATGQHPLVPRPGMIHTSRETADYECSHDSQVFLFLVVFFFYLHFFVLFVISFPVLSLVFRSFFVSN